MGPCKTVNPCLFRVLSLILSQTPQYDSLFWQTPGFINFLKIMKNTEIIVFNHGRIKPEIQSAANSGPRGVTVSKQSKPRVLPHGVGEKWPFWQNRTKQWFYDTVYGHPLGNTLRRLFLDWPLLRWPLLHFCPKRSFWLNHFRNGSQSSQTWRPGRFCPFDVSKCVIFGDFPGFILNFMIFRV